MNLYECSEIERQIELLAEQNEGVIPEDKLQALVLAQTTEIGSVERICNFIAVLEAQNEAVDKEIDRLSRMKSVNSNRVTSIKEYLKPWLIAKGGKFKVGTWTLGTRKSSSVQVGEDFNVTEYIVEKTVTTRSPDKRKIAEDMKAGKEIPGAVLVMKESVTIK